MNDTLSNLLIIKNAKMEKKNHVLQQWLFSRFSRRSSVWCELIPLCCSRKDIILRWSADSVRLVLWMAPPELSYRVSIISSISQSSVLFGFLILCSKVSLLLWKWVTNVLHTLQAGRAIISLGHSQQLDMRPTLGWGFSEDDVLLWRWVWMFQSICRAASRDISAATIATRRMVLGVFTGQITDIPGHSSGDGWLDPYFLPLPELGAFLYLYGRYGATAK